MHEQAHEARMTGTGNELAAAGIADDKNGKPAYNKFYDEHTPTRYSRSRDVDVRHIKLELSFDIPKKKLIGVAHLTVAPIVEGVERLTLDACDMEFGAITLGGKKLAHEYDGAKLTLHLPKAPAPDKEITVSIAYTVTEPHAGVYFIGPDEHYPDKPVEIWTQGQDEDAHYWFPCFDYPNEKATSEIVVTVPKQYNTLSNGKLVSTKAQGANKVYHWRHDTPHVAYLVTLVVGDFIEVRDEWDGIPVTYYHHPGDEKRAKNSFADTPKMVKFFSKKLGVRYPYAKYAQIPVTDFIFGGMENTTATTQTAFTLHDDRAHLDFTSNTLVSHELGHQWFGNLITCRDWSHGWLNEGFTTYMECCWQQEELGDEEFQYYMLMEAEEYFDEDRDSYRRPIVCNRYREPIELFDRHLYNKGALVQHMLRFILGERLFWKALNHYTVTNANRCVVTTDWQRAIEEATGRNLDEFFDQWVYSGGHPAFKLTLSYDDKEKVATLGVTQTQKRDDLTAIFKLPVKIAFTQLKGGKTTRREERTITVEEGEHNFNLPLDFKPDFVTFDVGNWILKTLDLSELTDGQLAAQLAHDSDCVSRIHAARALGKKATQAAVKALSDALGSEKLWFVQAAIAKALGGIGSQAALKPLLAGTRATAHPKARRAVVKALGEFKYDKRAADALLHIVKQGDESYFVEAEACTALGKTRDERAKDALYWAIDTKQSHNEVIRVAACEGLVELEDISALERIKECAAPGKPSRLRWNALSQYGKLARLADEATRRKARAYLEDVLEEKDFFVSLGTIGGLLNLGDPDARPALARKERVHVDGRVKARARRAAAALAGKAESPRQFKELRDELDEMRRANRTLTERLEKLESKAGARK